MSSNTNTNANVNMNMNTNESTKKERRSWGGRRSRSRNARGSSSSNTTSSARKASYVPPVVDDFVTSPPKQRDGGGLTTGISTLFRRAGSRDSPRMNSRANTNSNSNSNSNNNTNASVLEATLDDMNRSRSMNRNPSRLFANDDSDDSYESRMSTAYSRNNDNDNDDYDDNNEDELELTYPIQRFRGFSTSLQSLFLDESLVCASIGCFGLFLSQRTEFLLDVRNRQRGTITTITTTTTDGGAMTTSSNKRNHNNTHRYPSRVIGYALVCTIILMGGTFVIYGFGSNHNNYTSSVYDTNNTDDGQVYYQSNDDAAAAVDDDAAAAVDDLYNTNGDDLYNNYDGGRRDMEQNYQPQHQPQHVPGYFKIENYHNHLWKPLSNLIQEEWQVRGGKKQQQLQQQSRKLQNDDTADNVGATIRLVLAVMFLVILGVVGRRRRMRTRYALVRARAQEDHLFYASNAKNKHNHATEDNYEGACSHTLCGCYPVDPNSDETAAADVAAENPNDLKASGKKRRHQDCVSRLFHCLLAACCGTVCKCWIQCLSICALAQEAREVRLLVPPKFQRIDYITHQPFSEYQASVNDLRRGWLGKTRRKAGIWPHVQALSRLSRYILTGFVAVFFVISATLIFNPRASFSWPDLIVLIATFFQAFLVLYVIHWIFHKSDLSLDAVIKFFAAGFIVAVPSAFFLEGMLVNVILAVTYSLYNLVEWIFGEVFIEWVVSHYRFLWILGELVNAYIIAAVMEELAKYYTFRAVEHPDLVFLTGLNRRQQSGDAFGGGVVRYPYGSHQVSKLNRSNSFESVSSRRSTRSEKSATQKWIDQTNTEDEFFEDDNDVRTHRQKAYALTTGMISVAVGLACAENFLYVFLLGGSGSSENGSVKEEWVVLLFRSIFPVHALAAAIQSINLIRKFVECTGDANDHRIGVGRIILPAVLLHGSFDAVLLGINVYVETAWGNYLEANNGVVEEGFIPYNTAVVNIMAWLSITGIMIIGILWYYREHRNQNIRLKVLEQAEVAEGNGVYSSPSKGPPSSEIEIV